MWFDDLKDKTRRKRGGREKHQPSILRFNARLRDLRNIRRRCIRTLVALVGIVSALILLWLGLQVVGHTLFSRNDLFRITEYKIECSGNMIKPSNVKEFPGLSSCSNLFAFNIGAVREDWLKRIPRLKSVEISRRLPGVLTIRLSERMPAARLSMESYYLTVDGEGYVLGPSYGSRTLPVINGHCMPGIKPGVFLGGTSVMYALDVLDVCATTPVGQSLAIVGFDVRNRESLEFSLIGGEKVTLAWKHMGERSSVSHECLEKKLGRLVECLQRSATVGKRVSSIDMTLDNNFPATYR